MNENKFNLKDLESIAISMIGLPKLIDSPHKSARKYSNQRKHHILARLCEVMESARRYELYHPLLEFEEIDKRANDYSELLYQKKYAQAKKIATEFLAYVRREIEFKSNHE